jgi:hypothetical protein
MRQQRFDSLRVASLWRSWTLATAVGEVLGFAIPVLTGAAAFSLIGEPDDARSALAFSVLLPAAGVGEGTILGSAQWLVLRRSLPSLSRRAWVGATAAAAGTAWALGLLPSTIDALVAVPSSVLIGAWVLLAAPLLCTIGVAQWLVLRRHVAGAGGWVVANALGWLLGLPVTFIGPALVPNDSPPALWLGVFVVCGLLMGTVVGVVTGVALDRLLMRAARGGARFNTGYTERVGGTA